MSRWKHAIGSACIVLASASALAGLVTLHVPNAGLLAGDGSGAARAVATVLHVLTLAFALAFLVCTLRGEDRGRTMLLSSEDGEVNIASDALVSTARQALMQVDGASVHDVQVEMLSVRGTPVIDVHVSAYPAQSGSLVSTAVAMQRACKASLEAFTELSVRTVAIDYVEPRRARSEEAARPTAPMQDEDTPQPEQGEVEHD